MKTPTNDNHSIFGASVAKSWRACPGAPNVVQNARVRKEIPGNNDTEYSKEGTDAHNWGYEILTGKQPLEELPEDFALVKDYVKLCKGIATEATEARGLVLYEEKVPLYYRPQDEGTLDFAAFTSEWIKFVDFKWGQGIEVTAELNDQLIIYLLSLVAKLERNIGREYPDEMSVSLVVYQPRHHSFDGDPDTWTTTLRDLKDIGIDIENDYQRAKLATGEDLDPSYEACLFCPAKGVCSKRIKEELDPVCFDPMEDFEDLSASIADGVAAPEKIAFICKHAKAIRKLADDVLAAEQARIKDGGDLRSMKMIPNPRRGNRKWVDEKEAETFLKGQDMTASDRYGDRKLISPSNALKFFKPKKDELSTVAKAKLGILDEDEAKKSKTESLIHRPEGAPVLVPIDDPREAIKYQSTEEGFEIEVEADDILGDLF